MIIIVCYYININWTVLFARTTHVLRSYSRSGRVPQFSGGLEIVCVAE